MEGEQPMHSDAKQSSLSKVEVGQTILVTDVPGLRGFARPKDLDGLALSITGKTFVPDEWSGKQWTLTLSDGTETAPRYGTTHVYVVPAVAKPEPKPKKAKAVELHDVDTESGTKRVRVEKDGTVRVLDWQGGDVFETTPHGRNVHISEDGVLTVVEDDGTERQAVITRDDDAELDERNAGVPDPTVLNTRKCDGCKGYQVVRKRGPQAGKPYKTLNGAQAAAGNGNAVTCPVCSGTGAVAA
jgi:hypothetical protein